MQFRRIAEIIIGTKSFHSDVLDIEFDIDFDDTPNLNHAEIKIFNLSNSTIKSFKNKQQMIVNAGYEGDVGSVFIGAIYDIDSKKEGIDKVTTIKAIDASDQRARLRVNRSYKKGTRASQIITDLCRLSGISIGQLSLKKDVQYRNGKNVSGKPLSLLKQLSKDCNSRFKITKGLAYFYHGKQGNNVRFVFGPRTGLIGSPEPFKREEDEVVVRGYNVRTLLNHRVQENSIIELKSDVVTGKFRVIEGNHSYNDSEMVTEMEVV